MMSDRASFTGMPELVIHKPAATDAGEEKRKRRAAWHRALSDEAAQHNAWILTTCGADRTIVEALPTSAFPDILREREYPLSRQPDGERIIPFAVSTPMVLSSSGGMIPATPESTRPVTMTNYGAGPVRTVRYSFATPFA
jgi:hypothetical protein